MEKRQRIIGWLLLAWAIALPAAPALMLKPSAEYLALLKAAQDQRVPAERHIAPLVSLPPLPVDHCEYLIYGRGLQLEAIQDPERLLERIRQSFSRAGSGRSQAPNPGPGPDAAAGGATLDAPLQAWFTEIQAARGRDPGLRIRYIHLEDPVPGRISRLHFLIRLDPQGNAGSAASAAGAAGGRSIMDLGSKHGVILNGVVIPKQRWVPLPVGSKVRIRPLTPKARAYLEMIHAAGDPAPDFSRLDLDPLEPGDLRLEYELVQGSEAESAAAWARIDHPGAVAGAAALGPGGGAGGPGANGQANLQDPGAGASAPPAEARATGHGRKHGRDHGGDPEAKREKQDPGPGPGVPGAEAAAASASGSGAQAFQHGVQSALQCSICREMMYQPVSLACGHQFCKACILRWFRQSGARSCPNCRARQVGDVHPARQLDEIIALCAAGLSGGPKEERRLQIERAEQELKAQAQAHPPAPDGWPLPFGLLPPLAPLPPLLPLPPGLLPFRTPPLLPASYSLATSPYPQLCVSLRCQHHFLIPPGELHVRKDEQVSEMLMNLLSLSPFCFHPRCWAAQHAHDIPRPVLRGREALSAAQRAELAAIYPE